MKKKILLTTAVAAIIGATLLTSTQVFAQTTASTQSPMSSLVQKIADKFGLKKDDVQAVFDQSRQEMQAQRETLYEAELSTLVTNGKVTEAQKQLIIAKHKELVTNRQLNKNAEQKSLADWAKQNGIDAQYLRFGRHGRGFEMNGDRTGQPVSSSATTPGQ